MRGEDLGLIWIAYLEVLKRNDVFVVHVLERSLSNVARLLEIIDSVPQTLDFLPSSSLVLQQFANAFVAMLIHKEVIRRPRCCSAKF